MSIGRLDGCDAGGAVLFVEGFFMCGICGFTGRQPDAVIRKMSRAIIHRGPDEDGYYCNPKVSMSIRRLAIVDTNSGQQPVSNEKKDVWLVFNGEIYNHEPLRKLLIQKGHKFRSNHSDTEVIVHLYEEYGHEWVKYVNGMFAVAIWDDRQGELTLYRDRVGKKPLYYAMCNQQIIFGSEIKSLLKHPGISKEINYESLYGYFALKHISSPDTIYRGIKQILPGHMLSWRSDRWETGPYWDLNFTPFPEDINENEVAEKLYALLEASVKMRMQCDVPYGAYLSGGVDSSSVVSLMSQNQTKPVVTFCLGYADRKTGQFRGKAQDSHYASDMAKLLGTEHHELFITPELFSTHLPQILSSMDQPFSGTISTYFLSILMKEHVKVAISGDGADELFGSYLPHRLSFPMSHYLSSIRQREKKYEDLSDSDKKYLYPFDTDEQYAFLKRIASQNMSQWRDRLSVFNLEERKMLLSKYFFDAGDPHLKEDVYSNCLRSSTAVDPLNKTLEMDQRDLLPNQILPFVDRLSMAHSIEVRCPYLDVDIVEFVNRLPGRLKIKNGINKFILKKTVKKLLPEEIINRPKEGFVQPVYTWMHEKPLNSWIKENIRQLPDKMFNSTYIRQILTRYECGDQTMNAKVWNLVCFNVWYQNCHL